MNDQKNFIIAALLSALILLTFNMYFEKPAQQAAPETPKVVEKVEQSVIKDDRAEALKDGKRISVETKSVKGSINLNGARLDDLALQEYRETTAPKSSPIMLLNPQTYKHGYYATFTWSSPDSSLSLPNEETIWQSNDTLLSDKTPVTLTWTNGKGLKFERIISIDDNFMFSIKDKVTNESESPVVLSSHEQINRYGTPETGGNMILHEGPIAYLNNSLVEKSYSNLMDKEKIEGTSIGGWIGITDKYWFTAIIPPQDSSVKTLFYGKTVSGRPVYKTEASINDITVKPGASYEITHHLFAGAKVLDLLDGYETKIGIKHFDLAVDFGWFYFLTKPLFYLIEYLHDLLGNFGLAILVFTIIFKILFFPLANRSYRSMAAMKKLQPKIQSLQQVYADDKLRMNQELMALYKKESINPLSGCLPMLIQAPIFFCLYKVLFVTLEMRHAPFYGWIHDLSAPDPTTLFNLFGLIPWAPPSFLMIGAWPIIMGLTMYIQQRMNPQPNDPTQAMIFTIMPVMLTVLLASFPSGLVIYWAWSNILSMAQQWFIMRIQPQVAVASNKKKHGK